MYAMLLLAAVGTARGDERDEWALAGPFRARLDAGEIVVVADEAARTTGKGEVRAAVRIAASPRLVYAQMIDCAQALRYVPRLRLCRVLATAPDGLWQDFEHEVDYGWLLPALRYSFRAHYEPDRSVQFRALGGALRVNDGRWLVWPDAGGEATIVTYRVRIEPRFPVPRWLVTASLQRELPDLLGALRDHCERLAATP